MNSAIPKAKVLIVDDKHSNLVALASLLEPDHDVVFAGSGAEAIELVKKQPDVDVILMDVQMPGLDGRSASAMCASPRSCCASAASFRRSWRACRSG